MIHNYELLKKNALKVWSFLNPYPISRYPRFANTVDIVLLSIIDDELGVLLIKRKEEPYKDCWALPGGFIDVKKDVDALEAAKRELEEETGLNNIFLDQLRTYTEIFRDPRELVADETVRVTSIAHFALVDYTKVKAIAGSDAKEVKWFKMSKLPTVAFDHETMIDEAIIRIRNRISYTHIGFELVPARFTIPELRETFEKVLGRKINSANFRTKLLKLNVLDKTKHKRIIGKGQPAPIYTLNQKRLANLPPGETLFN